MGIHREKEDRPKMRWSPTSKRSREASEKCLSKMVGCQTEAKALEKLMVARIVQESDLDLFNPSEMG